MSKNRGYSTLKKIDGIINGEVTECDEDDWRGTVSWRFIEF